MCIYCTILPTKKPQIVFRLRRAVWKMCIYCTILPPKNNQYFFLEPYSGVVRFWTEFFSLRKKKLFFTYIWLSVQFWLVFCPLVQSFVICSFSGGQRTKVLISYLHQRGGYSATLGFCGNRSRSWLSPQTTNLQKNPQVNWNFFWGVESTKVNSVIKKWQHSAVKKINFSTDPTTVFFRARGFRSRFSIVVAVSVSHRRS